MPRPDKAEFTDSTVTEGGFKIALDSLVDWLGLMAGSVDEYLRIARGTDITKPAATEGGWLRWNTDNLSLDISVASSVWHKVVTSIIDLTWACRFDVSSAAHTLFKSLDATNVVTIRIQNNADDYVDVERTATATYIKSSGLDKIYFQIDGSNVMSIDSAGNIIAAGNISANGIP